MISRELREFSSSCIGLSVPQRRHESLIPMEGNDFTRIKKIHGFKEIILLGLYLAFSASEAPQKPDQEN